MQKPFPSAPTRIAAAAAQVAAPLAAVQAGDVMDPASDDAIEQRIQKQGLSAPRLTKELVQSVIADETYTQLEGTNVLVCLLTLANGHKVVGVAPGPVSAANFDAQIGCELAYKAALDQVWGLEGYLLRQRLHELGQAPEGATHQARPVFVTARKIVDVKGSDGQGYELPTGYARLVLDNEKNVTIDDTQTARYWPAIGDYYVVQSDGYAYINPADVFERKYAALK